MKEVRAIAVGEGGEYGRRLVRYLERHVPASVRIYHYTRPEALSSKKERADYYILDPAFQREGGQDFPEEIRENSIILTDEDRECSDQEEQVFFSRIRPPAELLDLMGLSGPDGSGWMEDRLTECRITALYSPVYESQLMKMAMTMMDKGDLYLGFEDLGPGSGHQTDVGDLCYYIHIRDDHILDNMEDLCDRSTGIFLLDSPDLFFCLKELTAEDYRWFFDRLRESRRYAAVYAGVGNVFLSDPRVLDLFDSILLVDSLDRDRQHALCGRVKNALQAESIDFRGQIRECLREEILGGEVAGGEAPGEKNQTGKFPGQKYPGEKFPGEEIPGRQRGLMADG